MANGNFGGGDGTESNPYLIEDDLDLDAVRYNLSACYKVVNDINLSEWNWTPIGPKNNTEEFRGKFDGNFKTISNLRINNPNLGTVGFFGYIKNAYIKNVILSNIDFTMSGNNNTIGGLFGYDAWSDIECCAVSGKITHEINKPNGDIGGIGGLKQSTWILKCSFVGEIIVPIESMFNVGGIVGRILLGSGGQVGAYDISDCYTNIHIAGGSYVGGIYGYATSSGKMHNCCCTGSIESNGDGYGYGHVGGIGGNAGWYSPINNSYCLLSEIKVDSAVLVGRIAPVSIEESPNNIYKNNYALSSMNTIGFSPTQIRTDGKDGANITEYQAKQSSTYKTNGWDFDTIWTINEGVSYPYLRFAPPEPDIKFLPGTFYAKQNGIIKKANQVFLRTNSGWEEVPNIYTKQEG